jgi:tetratricopeptide (TPR) repeat protein
VHARTDGNPFFVVELVELLRSERRLDAVAAALPPSVRDVLDRRLARLPEQTVELLRLAAVAGRDADLGLLQAAGQLDAEQVITRLEPAVVAGVVEEDDIAWSWRFSHALVQETLLAGLSRIGAARLHARVAQALQGGADAERLAHHFFHAVPVTGAGPAQLWLQAAAAAARTRLAHTEAAAHTRRALSLLGPGGDPAARHDLLVGLADDLLHSGHLQQSQDVVGEALAVARQLGDPDRLAEAASVWGGVTLWNWRAYGVVDEELVRVLLELVDRAGDGDPALRARLLGTLGVELAYSPRREEGVVYATRAVEIAREVGDPAVLGRALNNFSLAAWGAADRVERRLAAADEALALAGRGLPARTEFFARLHRGPLRLHLGEVTGFVHDLGAATRLAAGLTGPDVRPHLLYQETGLHMLRGAWSEAEELAEQVYALYRDASMWGAQCCWALHQFTFRRREGRLADVLSLLVDTGDQDVPIVQAAAVLAAVEVGDRAEAQRLRRRWSLRTPEDWTTDALVTLHARLALALDGDVDAAYARLLPYVGRQVVVGTATACWGSYDALLGELALARGDRLTAAEHLREADRLGRAIGSPWQTCDGAPAPARATS